MHTVEVLQLFGNIWIRVDLLERVIRLEAEELPELVERPTIPGAGLLDAEDRDGSHALGNVARAKGSCYPSAGLDHLKSIEEMPTGHLLNAILHNLSQIPIVEFAIRAPFESGEWSLQRILR